jgi:hypothetical protein
MEFFGGILVLNVIENHWDFYNNFTNSTIVFSSNETSACLILSKDQEMAFYCFANHNVRLHMFQYVHPMFAEHHIH